MRLEEIRLPRMQEHRSRNADRATETNNNMQKEELETGPEAVQDELPEGVAAAEALMEAEGPVALDDEEGSLPLAEHSEETVNLFSGESPDDNLEEMDYRTDTTVEIETDSTNAGRAERKYYGRKPCRGRERHGRKPRREGECHRGGLGSGK